MKNIVFKDPIEVDFNHHIDFDHIGFMYRLNNLRKFNIPLILITESAYKKIRSFSFIRDNIKYYLIPVCNKIILP